MSGGISHTQHFKAKGLRPRAYVLRVSLAHTAAAQYRKPQLGWGAVTILSVISDSHVVLRDRVGELLKKMDCALLAAAEPSPPSQAYI